MLYQEQKEKNTKMTQTYWYNKNYLTLNRTVTTSSQSKVHKLRIPNSQPNMFTYELRWIQNLFDWHFLKPDNP